MATTNREPFQERRANGLNAASFGRLYASEVDFLDRLRLDIQPRERFTVAQCAVLMGGSEDSIGRRVRRWCEVGLLRCIQKPGGGNTHAQGIYMVAPVAWDELEVAYRVMEERAEREQTFDVFCMPVQMGCSRCGHPYDSRIKHEHYDRLCTPCHTTISKPTTTRMAGRR